MSKTRYVRLSAIALVIGLTLFLASGPASAQLPLPIPLPGTGGGTSSSIGTSATALAVTVLGSTTTLASTGNLASATDALGAEMDSASGDMGSADVMHATAIGSGDSVASEASLGDLILSIAGTQVSATSAYATALADSTAGTSGWSSVDGLAVNGTSLVSTGEANQTINLGVITLVLNEVTQTASGITVNALHITSMDGTVDVVVASATAGQ